MLAIWSQIDNKFDQILPTKSYILFLYSLHNAINLAASAKICITHASHMKYYAVYILSHLILIYEIMHLRRGLLSAEMHNARVIE